MKKIFAYLTLGFTTLTTYAATPLWMRDIQISPDGTEIVFCYKGDIYKVSAKGGTATQLTTQESYESSPVWSPDGKQIAFASDRQGNFDVFVMPSDGGTTPDHQLGRRNPFRIHARRQVHPFLRRHTGSGRKCALPQSCHDRAL